MNLLGLSVFADSSVALIQDGQICFAIEEERLNRIKHYEGMPWLALHECLEHSDLSLSEIDFLAVGWNPFRGWETRLAQSLKSMIQMPAILKCKVTRGSGYLKGCREILNIRKSLALRYGSEVIIPQIAYVDHHLAHAASAFFTSPFEAANILVADGIGESAAISFFSGEGNQIRRLGRINYPHSLGHLYASVTGFLGFKMTFDEGKVMALAGFGRDNYRDLFSRLVQVNRKRRTIKLDTRLLDYHAARHDIFSQGWIKLTGLAPRRPGEPLTPQHEDLACSLQKCIEQSVFYLLEEHFSHPPSKPLCAAGGLFLNSVLNGEILRNHNRSFFIPSVAGDNGVSLGAALLIAAKHSAQTRNLRPETAFWGGAFDDGAMRQTLRRWSLHPRPCGEIFPVAAELIARGKIVGWFRGRMEFGPRALGNRSILACPAHSRIKDILNLKVKHREPFRPFAASVLDERASEYFQQVQESPFMLKVFYFKDRYRSTFPAITHVNGSCRLQTVTFRQNPDLYRLLVEIEKLTGHALVLNTSLNVAGQPIVYTPEEALQLLQGTNLDFMVLGDYIVSKQDLNFQVLEGFSPGMIYPGPALPPAS